MAQEYVESKCWSCKGAGGRCPWAQTLKPVPGCKTIKVQLRTQSNGKSRREGIHKVVDCPWHIPRKRKGGVTHGRK